MERENKFEILYGFLLGSLCLILAFWRVTVADFGLGLLSFLLGLTFLAIGYGNYVLSRHNHPLS